jgi:hypothetical protein
MSSRRGDYNANYGVFVREYKKGKITKPPRKYPKAYLLAFNSCKGAFAFLKGYADLAHRSIDTDKTMECFEIWEAETTSINDDYTDMEIVGSLDDMDQLIRYWTANGVCDARFELTEVPDGTVFCKDITLVNKMEMIL